MKMNVKQAIIPAAILVTVVVAGAFMTTGPKTGYVNIQVVYDGYDMKQELEGKLNTVRQQRKTILDSLELRLTVLSRKIEATEMKSPELMTSYRMLKEEYEVKRQQFLEDNRALAGQYDEQIWKQLNQYVKDFGEQQGYAYIYGADGTGVLMHADKQYEITAQVMEYINKRYNGTIAK